MKKQLKAYFYGHVQGVGFRATTWRVAQFYNIDGIVRNLRDGRVELIVEGEEQTIKDFIRELTHSHMKSYISHVDFIWGEAEGKYIHFHIVR
ncbi:acylphosphatase [Methylacidiphilum caldifontis]|uniref:acylphosphatase n=1 Tax=Methylacidiphilum caldifontis TaxID=2795386 RepID=A0A4Y8PGS0_9BACT|nr:acylphosphatase [Methylacidiphilum caldifontis]QSR88448.1 acylphosphatase [Methylacidiphilum caldifontis]TFE71277.1 acylphosphatase [Methylacidiphilum caldifontis]